MLTVSQSVLDPPDPPVTLGPHVPSADTLAHQRRIDARTSVVRGYRRAKGEGEAEGGEREGRGGRGPSHKSLFLGLWGGTGKGDDGPGLVRMCEWCGLRGCVGVRGCKVWVGHTLRESRKGRARPIPTTLLKWSARGARRH